MMPLAQKKHFSDSAPRKQLSRNPLENPEKICQFCKAHQSIEGARPPDGITQKIRAAFFALHLLRVKILGLGLTSQCV